ncbi:GntR family transcriptional regulator [Corallococcus aberystwythensis]|uniref:GntR family transcriptional regulator n=1 Tax=Corallococcus aberystwythensis TaxID=2316722 RepID=A0A3A8QTE5_9BACT|nr:GntR family transcriptional regulator [Corallococcus aberystwythensis]
MVRVGLVEYVEEQIERDIAQRRLPRNGGLASERKMARRFGVCRGTVREALRRLAARGLVVLRPGRQARAVALDESLTLENLGLALHDTRTQESRRLLEGFFSLKRQVLVELLSDCCANASAVALGPLESTCYALQDAARWYHPKERCAQLEFELLRLCAQVASRPGHLLLIQSLQRAFRGIADRLLPFMGGDAMRQWVICALDALYARDVQALQHQLPALMKTYDELVLDQLAPVPREQAAPEAHHAQEGSVDAPATDSAQDDAHETHPCGETRGPGAPVSVTKQDEALEACHCGETRGLGGPVSVNEQDEALEACHCGETRGLGVPVSVNEQDEALEAHPCGETRGFGGPVSVTEQDEAYVAQPCVETCGLGVPVSVPGQDGAYEAQPRVETVGLGALVSVTEQDEALEARPCGETRGLCVPTSTCEQDEAFDAGLRAGEQGLGRLASAAREGDAHAAHPQSGVHDCGVTAPATAQDDAPKALPCVEERGLHHLAAVATQGDAPEARSCVAERGLFAPIATPDDASETWRALRLATPAVSRPLPRTTEALGGASPSHGGDIPVAPDCGTPRLPAASGLTPCGPAGEGTGRDLPGAVLGNLSD